MNAYLLSDRGTWLWFKNRGDLAVLTEGDKRLFNRYGVMVVIPAKHPDLKVKDSHAFIDWLISPRGQETIARSAASNYFSPTRPTSRNATVETTTLSASRVSSRPSASGTCPVLVSKAIAAVILVIEPRDEAVMLGREDRPVGPLHEPEHLHEVVEIIERR